MDLHYRSYGNPVAGQPPLVLLHGLFGSGVNWTGIARPLSEKRQVLVPDLRNHGRSPHHPEMSYPAMAADLLAMMDGLAIESAWLVGHSLGAKVAMYTALERGDRVSGLVVVDMAPVRYPDRFVDVFRGLESLPLDALEDRQQADELLAREVANPAVRAYLLQNLVKQGDAWAWRMNLPVLSAARDRLFDFPQHGGQFLGPALFLYGGNSDYVLPEYSPVIRRLFPYARERAVAGAGHWVYAEKQTEFIRATEQFLAANPA